MNFFWGGGVAITFFPVIFTKSIYFKFTCNKFTVLRINQQACTVHTPFFPLTIYLLISDYWNFKVYVPT